MQRIAALLWLLIGGVLPVGMAQPEAAAQEPAVADATAGEKLLEEVPKLEPVSPPPRAVPTRP